MGPSATILHNVTPEELQAMIQASVKEEISVFFSKGKEPGSSEPEKPIRDLEARTFIGGGKPISRQTMYSLRKKGKVKAHVLSGSIFYFKSELSEAIKKR